MDKQCEVDGCTGHYKSKTVGYARLRVGGSHSITVDEYNALPIKKEYCAVTSVHCTVCDDDLDERLVNFIRENSQAFVGQ